MVTHGVRSLSTESFDMNTIVELYDPHPCPYGAHFSVPQEIKDVLRKISGKRMSLSEAGLLLAESVPHLSVFINHEKGFIGLTVEYDDQPYDAGHIFCLIKFRQLPTAI